MIIVLHDFMVLQCDVTTIMLLAKVDKPIEYVLTKPKTKYDWEINYWQILNLNLNLNSLLVTRQMTLFHQGVRMGEKLVP